MNRKFVRALILLPLLLLLSGCATMPKDEAGPRGGPAEVRELVKTTRSWDDSLLPAYPEGQPEITILRIRIPAGTRLDTHYHPVINAGVLISGQLTIVTTDGKTWHLEAGDPIVELVNTLHYGVNEGDTPADIIVFYAGIEGQSITVVETP